MTDKEFDLFLEETIDAPPPTELSGEFTPWSRAMSRIVWGTGLTTLTLNFWNLDVILCAIGWMMLLLGYRALRRENRWFRLGYGISWLRLVWFVVGFFLNGTIYAGEPVVRELLNGTAYAMLVPGFLILLALRNGIRAVQKKAGLPPHGGNGMLVWYLVMLVLALMNYQGFLGWGVLIAQIVILRSLFRLSGELDEAGYAVSPAPVRMGDGTAKWIYMGSLVLALVIGSFFRTYPMDWQAHTVPDDLEVQIIRQELVELGFPEHILDDLSREDILACKGALQVVVDVEDHPFNDGREVQEQTANWISIHTEYDQKELRVTGIAVELPGEREQWKIIHHFQWVINPGFRGTEAIQLWPAYRLTDGWTSAGEVSGQVLCDKEGQSLSASFYALEHETYTRDTIFWGAQTSTDVFAEFSLPNNGENHRGYVSYTIAELRDGCIIDAWINYTHQTSWFQYPVITAKENNQTVGVKNTIFFRTIQDALQFFPNNPE